MTSRLTNSSEPRRSVIATLLPLRYSVKVILKPQATGRIDKTVRDSSGYIYDQRLTSGGLWSRYPGGMTQCYGWNASCVLMVITEHAKMVRTRYYCDLSTLMERDVQTLQIIRLHNARAVQEGFCVWMSKYGDLRGSCDSTVEMWCTYVWCPYQ